MCGNQSRSSLARPSRRESHLVVTGRPHRLVTLQVGLRCSWTLFRLLVLVATVVVAVSIPPSNIRVWTVLAYLLDNLIPSNGRTCGCAENELVVFESGRFRYFLHLFCSCTSPAHLIRRSFSLHHPSLVFITMFARRILAALALAAVSAQAQLSITNPSPTSWWGTCQHLVLTLYLDFLR